MFINNNQIDLEEIIKIKEYIRKNCLIIQIESQHKIDEIGVNFINICDWFTSVKEKYPENNQDLNDILGYIFYKEIKKISDSNYHLKILDKLLENKDIIKKSNNIFQILLKKYIKTGKDEFSKNKNNILNSKDEIIKIFDKQLNDNKNSNYFVLTETLLYLFEKNSLIYLNNTLYDKVKPELLDGVPLIIFKEHIKFLEDYTYAPKKLEGKLKHICKLYCLGYIKLFLYTFIRMFEETPPKIKDFKNIISVINKNENKDYKVKKNVKYLYL